MILYVLYLVGMPAVVMLLARRWSWINKVSPMAVLYVIGLLMANLTHWIDANGLLDLNNLIGSVCIPLSIPLMLISCNLEHWSTGRVLKACLSGLAAVLIVVVAGFFLFRGDSDARQFAQVSAVIVGIYTGGIPNMGAIAQGVGMDNATYLYVTSYDLIVTGLYLVFVICFGKPVFRKLLPCKEGRVHDIHVADSSASNTSKPKALLGQLIPVAIALLVAVASYLLSTLFNDTLSTPMLILLLTTLAIGASFLPIVKKVNRGSEQRQPLSFTLGLYFVYLFCFSIANACDIRQMDLAGSLNILWYIVFVIFCSLVLQIIFAKLLHLDGDTTLVTSVAYINSPPFVPMVAALLGNKDLVVVGITIGMVGYLLGNYLGIGLFALFNSLIS